MYYQWIIGKYAEFNRFAFLHDSRIVLETKGAFRVTHETHDVSFYSSLLIGKQGQMMHHALHNSECILIFKEISQFLVLSFVKLASKNLYRWFYYLWLN